jgi:hypothetical protein
MDREEMIELVKSGDYKKIEDAIKLLGSSQEGKDLKTCGLIVAVRQDSCKIAELFIDNGADVDQLTVYCSFSPSFINEMRLVEMFSSPLQVAWHRGNYEMFELLIKKGNANINTVKMKDLLKFLKASQRTHYYIGSCFSDTIDTSGYGYGCIPVSLKLLQNVAIANKGRGDNDGTKWLADACFDYTVTQENLFEMCVFRSFHGDERFLELFFDSKFRCDLDALYMAEHMIRCNVNSVLKKFISSYLVLERENGYACLVTAACHNNVAAIECLLDFGVDVNYRTATKQCDILTQAGWSGSLEACQLLINRGATVFGKYTKKFFAISMSQNIIDPRLKAREYIVSKMLEVMAGLFVSLATCSASTIRDMPSHFMHRTMILSIRKMKRGNSG